MILQIRPKSDSLKSKKRFTKNVGAGLVSPYLLRPIRALDDVLKTVQARQSARNLAGRRAPMQGAESGPSAAILREQGRISRPRGVWVNQAANRRPGKKNRD